MIIPLLIEKSNGEKVTINVQQEDLVIKGKQFLDKSLNSSADSIKLFYNETLLQDDKKFSFYNINNSSVVKAYVKITFRLKYYKVPGDLKEFILNPWEDSTIGELLDEASKKIEIPKSLLFLKDGNQIHNNLDDKLMLFFTKFASANLEAKLQPNSVGFRYYDNLKELNIKYIEVIKGMTISELKKLCEQKLEIPSKNIILSYKKTILQDNLIVGSYIQNELYNEKIDVMRKLGLLITITGDENEKGPIEVSENTTLNEAKQRIIDYLKLIQCDLDLSFKGEQLKNLEMTILNFWDSSLEFIKFKCTVMYKIKVEYQGKQVEIQINKQDPIKFFKDKLFKVLDLDLKNFEWNCMDILYEGSLLEDNNTIGFYNLSGVSKLAFDPKMYLKIIYYETKDEYYAKLPRLTTIKELKEFCEILIGLQLDKQYLTIKGKEVDNEKTLEDYSDTSFLADALLEKLILVNVEYNKTIIGNVLLKKTQNIIQVKEELLKTIIDVIPLEYIIISTEDGDLLNEDTVEELEINDEDVIKIRDGRLQILLFFEDKSIFYEIEMIETCTIEELKKKIESVTKVTLLNDQIRIENELISNNQRSKKLKDYNKSPLEVHIELSK